MVRLMVKESCKVIMGSAMWNMLKLRDGLDSSKVVLILTGDNSEVDRYALVYLDDIIERKKADSAVVYLMKDSVSQTVCDELNSKYPVNVKILKDYVAECIYRRYVLYKEFYKNIFWTFTDHTKNNLLGRFMRETSINAEDVVCLAIYNFRRIPSKVIEKNVCG